MLAVVHRPGVHLDCAELVQRVDSVLPRFARPRYVELIDELPRTPTAKVRKAEHLADVPSHPRHGTGRQQQPT